MGRPRSSSTSSKNSSRIYIEASSLKGILQNMEHIDRYIKRVALGQALDAGGEMILDVARQKVKKASGHLSRSLGMRKKIVLQTRAQYSYAVIGPIRRSYTAAIKRLHMNRSQRRNSTPNEVVNSATQYSHFVEYGTSPHPIGSGDVTNYDLSMRNGKKYQAKGAWHPGAKPQPFLRPAYDEKKDLAIKVMGEILADAVERGSA